ncbi:class I SAM-dependent methyltransferase [Yunchengibacter salinarum]|uniref:class I SAM-dependent methyltransferase n=1 Tax=Yunchengibacter salinarum TaxID=3133399 RepID=UPI0035B67E5E
MVAPLPHACPLCGGGKGAAWHRDHWRPYWRCAACLLVFVPAPFHLDARAEKAEYDAHDNRVDDPGYRRFLSRLADPVLDRLTPGARVLDFGCGPGPALLAMLREAGHDARGYDPFYAPDPAPLSGRYDAITLSEVAEHLAAPGAVFRRLWGLLEPGAFLAVMTKRQTAPEAFARWHYIRDRTHVCFFHDTTVHWLARHLGGEADLLGPDVFLIRKGGNQA